MIMLETNKIKEKKPTKGKKVYPVLPECETSGGRKLSELVGEALEYSEKAKALASAASERKNELIKIAREYYLQVMAGNPTPSGGVVARNCTEEALISFSKTFDGKPSFDEVKAILGEKTEALFEQKATISVDLSIVPAEKRQALYDSLADVCERFSASEGFTQKTWIAPKAGFEARRFVDLTFEQNKKIEKLVRGRASVRKR